jgi:hypothetical protein
MYGVFKTLKRARSHVAVTSQSPYSLALDVGVAEDHIAELRVHCPAETRECYGRTEQLVWSKDLQRRVVETPSNT